MQDERLVIKNFGPIKHIDIPIRKINVLIGDQGTGKSTVAKVLAICKNLAFVMHLSIEQSFELYGLENYVNAYTEIKYKCEQYSINYDVKSGFTAEYIKALNDLIVLYKKELNQSTENQVTKQLFITDFSTKIQQIFNQAWYVPAERVKPMNSFHSLLKNNYIDHFHQYISDLKNRFPSFGIPFIDTKYNNKDNVEVLIKNGIEFNLKEASTGLQNIVPIVLFSKMFVSTGIGGTGIGYLIVEEPELSLFPNRQRDLINYLIEKIYRINDYLFFTTHSPYILSSLNNLIYAHEVGQINNEDVNNVIDKKYWINPSDVSAYLLNDKGEVEDLMDKELQQIAVERIDEISQTINEEYEKLNDIFWAKK